MSQGGRAGMRRTELLYASILAATLLGTATALLWPSTLAVSVAGAFVAIIGAALMISLGAEVAEFFISQGLAVAAITYRGEVNLMLANFTGANRLLMGAGWPLVYAVAAWAHRREHGRPMGEVRLRPENVIETVFLAAPSAYLLVVLYKGTLTLLDSAVLAAMFVVYIGLLNRLPSEGEESREDVLPLARRVLEMRPRKAGIVTLALLAVGGMAIVLVAEPFVASLQVLSVALGVSAFFFIQWVAPFLSEFPEGTVALYWARRVRLAPLALLNVISSKINQWTLLILFIPVFYSLGLGHVADIPLGEFQRREVFLTIAMTAYGVAVLLKRRFMAVNAGLLFSLWCVQFVFAGNFPGTDLDTRSLTAAAFLLSAMLEVVLHRGEIHPLKDLYSARRLMNRRGGRTALD